jgi:uncharacterized protein
MVIQFFMNIARFPKTMILVALLLTALFTYKAYDVLLDDNNNLIVDSTVEPFMSRGSGTYEFFKKIRNIFGSEEILVVAFKPNNLDRFNLKFFLLLDEFTKSLQAEVPGVKNVLSLTNTPRIDGLCGGKSFFHIEGVGSTCESVLDDYFNQLECARNKEKYQALLRTDKDEDLEGDLDEEPDDLEGDLEGDDSPDDDTAAIPATSDGPVCTADMFEKTESDIYQEIDQKTAAIFKEMQAHTMIQRDLISPDFKTAAIIVEFKLGTIPNQPEIQEKVKEIIKKYESPDLRIGYSGQSRQEYLASKTITEDITRILPWSIVLMMITLFFSFKSIRGVLIPLLTVVTGILWTFGFFAITGFKMNLVTMVLPPLLMCVGSAYIIHFMNQYFQDAVDNPGAKPKEVARLAIQHITVPLTVTALTTLAGFAALAVSPIPAIKEMGLFACFGIAAIILLTLTYVPAILSLVPVPKAKKAKDKKNLVDRLLTQAANFVGQFSRRFIIFWVLLGVIAVIGLLQVKVDSETKNFPYDHPVERDLRLIQENLAGTNSLRMILSSKTSPQELQTAETINGLIRLREWLLQANGPNELKDLALKVDKVYSVLEYINIYRSGLDNITDREVASFYREARKRNLPKFLSDDGKLMQANIRLQMTGTTALLQLRDMLDQKIPEYLPNLSVEYTGSGILSSESADNISRGQVQSVILALAIIFVILSLLFFSFKMGFVALYPNVIAIAVFFGTLGWVNIPIGVTISIIASIALGIGVDDTIHFLSHHNENVKKLRNEKDASMKTLVQTGRPMVYTTISLGLGFVIFYLADMESQVYFGVLTAYTLVVCLVTDLNFLPSIMVHTKLITAWDYIGLSLKQAFLEKVDIFKGMTMRETKLATLTAYTVDLEPEQLLFKERDLGNELFVILEGKVDIYLDEEFHDERRMLAQLIKGQSFGEMGLFRHSKRAASVRASEQTQLLVLNEQVLLRLQKRYPKIATKLFINLAQNLGGAIIRTDQQIAEKRIRSTEPSTEETPPVRSIKEVVDEIIADGVVSAEEQMDLDKLIYADHVVSKEEQEQINRLNHLIESGEIVKEPSPFLDIFQKLSKRQYRWLLRHFEVKNIPANVRVYSQGDYGDYMLLILKGKFNAEKEIDGEITPVATIFEGNIIGSISMILSQFTRTCNISCIEEAEVMFLSMKALEMMQVQNVKLASRFYYNIVCMLSDRLEQANREMYG